MPRGGAAYIVALLDCTTVNPAAKTSQSKISNPDRNLYFFQLRLNRVQTLH